MYKSYIKHLIDVFAVLLILLIIWPLLVLISVLIIIFDPGPVIFTQKRVGKDGNLFRFYKFRSMPINTGDKTSAEIENIEISWIGKILRRTNMDELPKLVPPLHGLNQ